MESLINPSRGTGLAALPPPSQLPRYPGISGQRINAAHASGQCLTPPVWPEPGTEPWDERQEQPARDYEEEEEEGREEGLTRG